MAKHRCHSIEFNDISRNLTREAGAFDEDVRAAWDQGGPSAPRRTTLHDGQDGLDFPTLAISGVISEFARLAGPPAFPSGRVLSGRRLSSGVSSPGSSYRGRGVHGRSGGCPRGRNPRRR